jgi:hypothetical protein
MYGNAALMKAFIFFRAYCITQHTVKHKESESGLVPI